MAGVYQRRAVFTGSVALLAFFFNRLINQSSAINEWESNLNDACSISFLSAIGDWGSVMENLFVAAMQEDSSSSNSRLNIVDASNKDL